MFDLHLKINKGGMATEESAAQYSPQHLVNTKERENEVLEIIEQHLESPQSQLRELS